MSAPERYPVRVCYRIEGWDGLAWTLENAREVASTRRHRGLGHKIFRITRWRRR